jgi:beta-phosphoglucomutase-like phosphatase (HAD superfamily)/dTDP-glucose pyrophosphorylase
MIKAVIFDLDGVLADTAGIHAAALNRALQTMCPTFSITPADYTHEYGSLTTKQKIARFFEKKGLAPEPVDLEFLYSEKQRQTELLLSSYRPLPSQFQLIANLKHRKYKLAVCSNANRHFVRRILESLGVCKMFDVVLTPDDVQAPKPSPEMYLDCIVRLGVLPRECLIFEDSYHGVQAAYDSGAHVSFVSSPFDLDPDWVQQELRHADDFRNTPPIRCDRLTVLVPMAGAGSRFEQAGFGTYKPMIPLGDSTILGTTLDSLPNVKARYVFIVQKQHCEKYDLVSRLRLMRPGCRVVQIEGLTMGAACTALLAKKYIDNNDPLLILNSDQLIIWDRSHLLHMLSSRVDGGIVVFEAENPKWSYAKNGPDGFVCEVAEKRAISNQATCGIYYWARGSDYVKYAERMIRKDVRVNNEFYVCPVYNEAIQDGKKIKTYPAQEMWGLGDPESVVHFLAKFPR